MSRADVIREKLTAALSPERLDVIDESHMHSVPKGAETHFKVVVVSPAFEAKNPVARHRLVYAALGDELRQGLHALTVTPKTPAEWAASPEVVPSPACAGGAGK